MIKVSKFDEITRFDLAKSVLGHGLYWTTAYLVDGLLVDTGCAHAAPELNAILAGCQLDHIVNTHSHEDHIGGNAMVQKIFPGIQTHAHPSAIDIISNPEGTQPLHVYRKFVWGMPRASRVQAIEHGSFVKTKNHQFQVIFTPGHTADHLCLYEQEKGWVFTGDLFVGGKDRAIRAGSDIWKIIESLKLIAKLPLSGMFPSSAQVRKKPDAALQEKIYYLETTGEKVLELAGRGWNEKEISQKMFGGAMWIELFTLGHLSRRNLVRSYLAYYTGQK